MQVLLLFTQTFQGKIHHLIYISRMRNLPTNKSYSNIHLSDD